MEGNLLVSDVIPVLMEINTTLRVMAFTLFFIAGCSFYRCK